MRKITHIFIHCAATTPSMDIGRAEIDTWHRARGMNGIGYHYVIRRNGVIELGRTEAEVGAHVQGYNAHSIGVCMVGGVRRHNGKLIAEDNFTPEQWASLEKKLRELHARYPEAKILGHRDVNAGKECPSFSVRDYIARIGLLKNDAAGGIAWDSGTEVAPPPPLALTKPVVGSATAGAAGLGVLGDTINEHAANASVAAAPFPTLKAIVALLIVVGTGLVIYSAWASRRKTGR